MDAFKFNQGEEVTDTSKVVKVGIIGTGWIAESHIKALLEMPDVEIVSGADLIPGKAEKFFADKGIEGIKCYLNHKELIDANEVDAVCICTYNPTNIDVWVDIKGEIYCIRAGEIINI